MAHLVHDIDNGLGAVLLEVLKKVGAIRQLELKFCP